MANAEVNKRWRHANPQVVRAHTIVNWEVRNGRLSPQPCEVCGKEKTHAHHDDYAKPLQVRWLCSYHHRKFHHPEPAHRYIKTHIPPKHLHLANAQALREQGLSYKQIAKRLGVSQGTAYKWLNPDKPYK